MVLLDRDQLAAVVPMCKNPGEWTGPLNAAMTRFGLNDDVDVVACFLAQVAVESMELNRLDENLSYRAERLMEVWPKRFPTIRSALLYARNPQALSNKVYANRLGNGDEASGDGYRYRGRGLIMVTGRDNYAQVDEGLGLKGALLANPDLLTRRGYAALSAALFWSRRPKLNELADDLPTDDDDADFTAITKIVNGAHHGLAQRRVYWQRAKKALGA